MLVQIRSMQLRPLTDAEKDLIQKAKTLAKDRISLFRAEMRKKVDEAQGTLDRYTVQREHDRLVKEGFVSGNPVRLVNDAGLTLTVDYNWLRQFLRGLSLREWECALRLLRDTPTGPVYLKITYEHRRKPGRFGKALHYGLPALHVRALDGINLPEIHVE